MNYEKMTDFEINKAVAIARGYAEENCDFGWAGKPDVGVEWSEEAGYPTKSFNYCNSWADAGPIIACKFIAMVPAYEFQDEREEKLMLTGRWGAESINEDAKSLVARDSNPLRAAMIVFLMMQGSKCSN